MRSRTRTPFSVGSIWMSLAPSLTACMIRVFTTLTMGASSTAALMRASSASSSALLCLSSEVSSNDSFKP